MSPKLLTEFAEKVVMPDYLWNNEAVQNLIFYAIDFASWHNDIWLFKKEISIGDVHSLVSVISVERGLPYTKGAEIVMRKIQDRLQDLERTIEYLERETPAEQQLVVSEYIKTAKNRISGTHEWTTRDTERNFC